MIARRVSRLPVHPNHRRIAAGALTIGALTIIAKLFVAGREIAIAWRFGVSSTVDAYQLALTATTWIPLMLAGVMSAVLVPRLVRLNQDTVSRYQFLGELSGTVLIVALAITGFTWLLSPFAATLLASHQTALTLELTASMTRGMAALAVLMILSGYLSARLQARERYGYSITEAVPAITIAAFVIAPGLVEGSTSLVWGTVAGYFLQAVMLLIMVNRRDGPMAVTFRHRSDEWRTLYRSGVVMAAAQLTLGLTIPIDQAFAARLGLGSVATLGYANRIVFLATSFGAVVLARALLPVLSGAVARDELELGSRQARQWALLLAGVGIAAAGCIWLLADFGVAALFQHGAFTRANTRAVADLLRVGALQLPFYFGGLAVVQWLVALGRYSTLLIIAGLALGAKLLLNLIFVRILGLDGIMVATTAMYALSFSCQLWITRIK